MAAYSAGGARRVLWWGIPSLLVAALAWTVLPHPRSGTPILPAAVPPASPPASSPPAAATPAPSTQAARPRSVQAPFARIKQGDLSGTDTEGRRRWRIVADSVVLMQNGDRVLLRNVRATLYQTDGGTIQVAGAVGRFDTKTHEVEIEGGVRGASSSGRELFADRIRWTASSGRIVGTGHVRLVQQGVVMYADEMQSDTILGQTRFLGHVHASVR